MATVEQQSYVKKPSRYDITQVKQIIRMVGRSKRSFEELYDAYTDLDEPFMNEALFRECLDSLDYKI